MSLFRRQPFRTGLTLESFLENPLKITLLRSLSLAALLVSPLALAVGCTENGTVGTSHVVSHSESNKKGWFGGQYHEANTVYKNSDGSTSVESETVSTKNGTTTIIREKKTTTLDGKVTTTRAKRTMVEGSDNIITESTISN
jgi:hypothetical protein